MKFNIPTINEIIGKSTNVFKRFPLAILSSFIATLITIYLFEVLSKNFAELYTTLTHVALSAMLGAFVFTSVHLLKDIVSIRIYRSLIFLTFVGLFIYFLLLNTTIGSTEELIYLRHVFLIILFFIIIFWIPFIRADVKNEVYWIYVKEVLFAFVTTVVLTIAIILGVNGALYGIQELFKLGINSNLYVKIDLFILGIFSVGYFLSQLPKEPLHLEHSKEISHIEEVFTKFILTPLSIIYFIILYAYTFKVVVTMNLPDGILVWLIIIFSIFAIITYLFGAHFTTTKTRIWHKWIWLAILLQIIMLFIAITIRIHEYSWTLNRYFVVMLGAWLAIISIYFLLFKNAKIKWIFITLSLFIMVSQVTPFSAYEVTKIAQQNRLKAMLLELKKKSLTQQEHTKLGENISETIAYLYRYYSMKELEQIMPKICKELNIIENYWVSRYCSKYTESKLGTYDATNNAYFDVDDTYSTQTPIDARGYDYMIWFYGNDYKNNDIGIELLYKKHIITAIINNKSITFDMKKYIDTLVEKYGTNKQFGQTLNVSEMTLKKEKDGLKVKIEVKQIRKYVKRNGDINIHVSVVVFFADSSFSETETSETR